MAPDLSGERPDPAARCDVSLSGACLNLVEGYGRDAVCGDKCALSEQGAPDAH